MRLWPTLAWLLIAAGATALAFAPAVAQAQGRGDGQPRGPSHTMQLLDTDGDGKIGLAEIRAEQDRLVGAADVDGDGKLSVDEFRRRGTLFMRLGTTSYFDLLDADGDRILTLEEIAKPSERWFSRHDANNDGKLESEEVPRRRALRPMARRHKQR